MPSAAAAADRDHPAGGSSASEPPSPVHHHVRSKTMRFTDDAEAAEKETSPPHGDAFLESTQPPAGFDLAEAEAAEPAGAGRHAEQPVPQPASPVRGFAATMHAPVDPCQLIVQMILSSAGSSVSLREIAEALDWEANYAHEYPTVLDYLQGYQKVFKVSPVADRVALRDARGDARTRRSTKPVKPENVAEKIGSVSYSYVAEAFDLPELLQVYRSRGFVAAIKYDVLHVAQGGVFDMFVSATGVVVWWGMNRTDHWIVDDDFLQPSAVIGPHMTQRHPQNAILELFPIWCTYQVDSGATLPSGADTQAAMAALNAAAEQGISVLGVPLDLGQAPSSHEGKSSPASLAPPTWLEKFREELTFDHYVVPGAIDDERTLVMLTVSIVLGRSAKLDFFQHVTEASQTKIVAIPIEPKRLLDHRAARRRIAQLEGELRLTQVMMTSLHDTPDVLWDMPRMELVFRLAMDQMSVVPRLDWFTARSDALFQKLNDIKVRRHRLFMMSSDVFLIGLLVLDVIAMLARLIIKLFFSIEEVE